MALSDILTTVVYIAIQSINQGPVIFTYITEITVDKAIGFTVFFLQALAVKQVLTITAIVKRIRLDGTLHLFAAKNLVSLIFVIVMFKETKYLKHAYKKVFTLLPKRIKSCLLDQFQDRNYNKSAVVRY